MALLELYRDEDDLLDIVRMRNFGNAHAKPMTQPPGRYDSCLPFSYNLLEADVLRRIYVKVKMDRRYQFMTS